VQILALGMNYSTGDLLVPPADEETFGTTLVGSLAENAELLANLTQATTLGQTFRGEIKRQVVDLGDPRSAGWTILVNGQDPQKDNALAILRPLAEHRGMKDVASPLVFNGEPVDEWFDWLTENYSALAMGQKPHYILIAGGPEQVPFLFQSMLDTVAATGRVAFDSAEDLRTYVDKVIRIETVETPVVEKEALFFAPDYGWDDPTYFSCQYMVEPLAKVAQNELGFNTKTILRDQATKERLQETLRTAKPAMVFTASHGMGAPDEPFEKQKQINGAICCQRTGHEVMKEDWLLTADDVSPDEPFLEGAAVFQFACFGYGTPAESDFAHWDPRIGKLNAPVDFISALPKRLLAHPRGPLAYVGHVDVALLHGFADPGNPMPALGERWNDRIGPFYTAIRSLLSVDPVSLAMEDMFERYNIINAQLTATFDRLKKGRIELTPDFRSRFVDLFLTRSDAQNYMIYGDPAVYLRIPD
jgi:Peptidase family C25